MRRLVHGRAAMQGYAVALPRMPLVDRAG
jgi:hypothetical protein